MESFVSGKSGRRFLNQDQCDNSVKLCQFLEKVRSAFGDRPIIITSGHRPPDVNREQGGAIPVRALTPSWSCGY